MFGFANRPISTLFISMAANGNDAVIGKGVFYVNYLIWLDGSDNIQLNFHNNTKRFYIHLKCFFPSVHKDLKQKIWSDYTAQQF